MTSTAPPPPPSAASGATPWYKSGSTPLLLGLLVAGAIGGGVYLFFSGGDDDGVAVSTSTTAGGGVTTTAAAVTTSTAEAPTTTAAAPTTTAAAPTTTLAAPTTTLAPPTTTTAPAQLDFHLPAAFATEDLAHLFLPDPWTQPVAAGGSVDVSYLDSSGGPCFGYAAQAPDVQITWSGGGTLLRFYFIADTIGDDTVLIINDPSGGWYCGDDSPGTSNPTVDFNSPINGVYDIWVGTYASGPFMNGDLFVTELEDNHP